MKQAEYLSNGLIDVPNIDIEYRGYHIVPKRDFGSTPYQSNGCVYRKGYIVTDSYCNVMYGGIWFHSVPEAKCGIDDFILSEGNSDRFWELTKERDGRSEWVEI